MPWHSNFPRIGLILLLCCSLIEASLCPPTIQAPCTCTSTKYQTLSVVCDKAASLANVLESVQVPDMVIEKLIISNTPIEELPALAFSDLKIRRLSFRNNGMFTINPDAFEGWLAENLEELEIRSNYLDHIPQVGLTKLTSLKILSLSDNLIREISDNAFLSYLSRTAITNLDLSANNLAELPVQAFLGLESLKQLSLDKNSFKHIPSTALENVPSLEELNLSVNQIEYVGENSLPLPLLKSLSLEVNQIREIEPETFETVPQLTYLYIGNNLFANINPDTFYYLKQLKVLSMSNNKDISEIKLDSFQYLPMLIRLEMSDCSLTNIVPQALHKFSKIQVLVLSRNQLTGIAASTFSALSELITVDLSSNSIYNVEDFAFSQLPSLEHMDLSGNRLENLPAHIFYESFVHKKSPRHRTLFLNNNPWKCDTRLQWLRKFVRENGDILTSLPGTQDARCWSPATLRGLDIRQTDPVLPAGVSQNGPKEMRKYATKPPPTLYGQPLEASSTKATTQQLDVSQANLLMLVVGIIFGFVALAAIVIIATTYIKPRFEKKVISKRGVGG
ncbi:unnamed protein product, partial [Mesorhabditis spiculigera]